MQRPEIRQVDHQRVENEREVTGWEAEEILRKYGHSVQQSTRPEEVNPSNNLTFEEMLRQEEMKRKSEEQSRMAKLYGPKPTTFGSQNGYDSEIKWGQDEESGFGFKIEIVTDMKLPK